jgi:octaprenyl-diphosphate synthase
MSLKIYDPKDFPAYLPIRSKLVGILCKQIQADSKTQLLLSQTIEFIHNASLLHDDLIDRSILRRGKTTAWKKYTPEYAVLAGDYLLARVMVNLSGYGNIKLVQYTAEMISDLLEGEWLQDSLIKDMNVELSQLDRVHNLKTASLFKWCLRAPFIAMNRQEAGLHTALEEMGTLLGQLFQRSDDLLDYDIRNSEGKAVLGDLRSGYLNSFAAFASRGLSREQREKLRQCQDMSQFCEVLGGEKNFKDSVAEFDKMNEFLIQLYSHHLNTLSGYLNESEKGLIQDLKPLTDILYWRKV